MVAPVVVETAMSAVSARQRAAEKAAEASVAEALAGGMSAAVVVKLMERCMGYPLAVTVGPQGQQMVATHL